MTTSESKFTRYKVQSTDVLQDARINVFEESSDQVVWFKERFLSDNEIIEHLVHSPTSTICWIIHRPSQKGWYIRVRSPTFPPGTFIPVIPLSTKNPLYSEGALSFKSRTSLLTPTTVIAPDYVDTNVSTSSVHSYPPTPPVPTLALSPPSPKSALTPVTVAASASSAALLGPKFSRPSASSNSVSEFILAPSTEPPSSTPNAHQSLFSRAMRAFRYYEKDISSGYSFSLARAVVQSPPPYTAADTIRPSTVSHPVPPATASILPPISTTASSASSSTSASPTPRCVKALPVLTFTDLTSTFTVGSLNGVLQMDRLEAEMLGVDPSFWVAVALTYLDFLEDRGSYLASLGDW
ncbi:hypothetical protein BDP27DRAFT_1251791 [Rhodocollybia butyracea]|uniref:Uncharacterized protein n=1 Tax=Rhodocollybia butyracea TaxID=206335 RepID=A0A9P5UFG7_9AGAR|nr:hypothetical protein BDP27DRAFT_1251791 [Rhodocollybia butyracea]